MPKLINEAEIKSRWLPMIKESTGVQDAGRLNWMSLYAHYHSLYEANATLGNVPGMGAVQFPANPGSQFNFATDAEGSGDKPFTLLPLAMQVAAQTIGLDLVPVVPMQGPMGILTYVDFIYAGGKFDSITDRPEVFKVNVTGSYTVGTSYDVEDTNNANAVVLSLNFVGTSRLDGYKIFEVGTVADASLSIADIFDGTANGYELSTNAANVAIAAEAEFVKALEDHLTGFSGNNYQRNLPMQREVGESSDYNNMGLNFFNKSISAETYQVAIAITREQLQDSKQFGFDVIAQANAIIANELTQSINKHIIDRVFEMGATNHANIFASEGTDLNLNLSANAGISSDLGIGQDGNAVNFGSLGAFSATTGENLSTIQRRILGRMLGAANLISIRGRRGAGDTAVVNGQVASALQDISGFVPAPINNSISQSAGSLYPVGSIAGINVYVDPNKTWDDTNVAVFRKGDGNTPGLVMMPYLMAESVETIAEGTFAPRIAAKSRYKLAEAGHHPELNYVTFRIHPPAEGLI